jgi:predicted N-acetyltransferase YhbS
MCRTFTRTTPCPTTSWKSSDERPRRQPVTGPGPAAPELEVRPLGPRDDLASDLDLARRAFGPFGAAERADRLASVRHSVGAGRHFGAFSGGQLLGSALFHDMTQWWHGRSLRMAGVAGVKVAPEARGAGIGRSLMTVLLADIAARGYPLSALYPATTPLYRAMGYELAGDQYQVCLPPRSLRSLLPPDPVPGGSPSGRLPLSLRRAGPADAAEVNAVIDRVYELGRYCGPVNFDLDMSRQALDDEDIFCYLADDGCLIYSWSGGPSQIDVYCAVASSAATTRALWSIIASHDSIAATVRAFVGPADPIRWLTQEQDAKLAVKNPWMLRVIDAPAAIAGRGFPAAAQVTATVLLDDSLLPANTGRWQLTVRDGRGTLALAPAPDGPVPSSPVPSSPIPDSLAPDNPAVGAGPLRLGARGFAALYAGTPVATLRLAGLAAGGDPAADAALDTAFGTTAFMLDYF